MREIKFRAWDKNNDFMIFIQPIDFEAGCEFFTDDNFIIEQFTGLYDKNGKEIYEGDIVSNFTLSPCIIIFNNGGFCYTKINHELDMGVMSFSGNYHFQFDKTGKSENIEIIGNVHENPEILEVNK